MPAAVADNRKERRKKTKCITGLGAVEVQASYKITTNIYGMLS